MSISIMSEIWSTSEQKGSGLLMLLALADFMDDEGKCWPKIDTLAKKTRLSRSQSMRLLAKLESEGEIIIDRRLFRGMKTNSVYNINPKYLRSSKMTPRSSMGATSSSSMGATSKPSNKHQNEIPEIKNKVTR